MKMESVTERLEHLKRRGYTSNLSIKEGVLWSRGYSHIPTENVRLDETYRIEDDSDPTQQTIIHAISCESPKLKGILINSFGPYSEKDKDKFISLLQIL